MNRLFVLCVVLAFTTIGCTARHVVIDPDEVSGLNNAEWTISEEPSHDSAQPKSKEKERQEDELFQTP